MKLSEALRLYKILNHQFVAAATIPYICSYQVNRILAIRFLNTILLVCVLFSSTGFVLGKHHCKRMERMKKSNAEIASCADMGGCKKGCCTKEAIYFHLDQDQQLPQLVALDLPKCPFLSYTKQNWTSELQVIDLHAYQFPISPPPISHRDKLVLFQVFRC